MRPHVFRAKPIDSTLRGYAHVCGHVDVDAKVFCVQPRDHPDHVEPDALEVLDRRMRGAPLG